MTTKVTLVILLRNAASRHEASARQHYVGEDWGEYPDRLLVCIRAIAVSMLLLVVLFSFRRVCRATNVTLYKAVQNINWMLSGFNEYLSWDCRTAHFKSIKQDMQLLFCSAVGVARTAFLTCKRVQFSATQVDPGIVSAYICLSMCHCDAIFNA